MKLNWQHIQILEQVKEHLEKRGIDDIGADFLCFAVSGAANSFGFKEAECEIRTAIDMALGQLTFGTWLCEQLGGDYLDIFESDEAYHIAANHGRLLWVETMIARREIS